ncbi:MAG: hypothetical protein FJ395_19645 [Verrucomicrobia bacterium]|nr:hypothetical protein [Verrucomicrobiota bacterium]
MRNLISRRAFAKAATFLAAGVASPFAWNFAVAASVESAAVTRARPRYRAVSWWLTWDDLTWPNAELMDKIRRRADQCAANAVNCCLIFGAHFRWDFLPLWGRLHDELRFIAGELHQRKILLFDHHSSVLTHRPRNREDALNIWRRNRHHVPFYPSPEEATTWQFDGSRLNDWRMLDVETGAPVYMPAYEAEQFCMNNLAFRAAYGRYVKRLLAETGVDGLMSDDQIFYAGWRACACDHCRKRFKREYGHELPPVSDAGFWGNRRSEAFRDWIAMRFHSSGDFLAAVKKAVPAGFPLLTCCSSSDGHALPAYGMSYQDFIEHSNHVLLEMVGSTPSPAGTWDDRIPSQLLHLGIARDHSAPCFGLGYGFFPDTAFFVWAVNKFLGSDSWFSTLKGRLNASPDELATLGGDAELVGEGYRWERDHPQLFTGEVDTDVAVFFSRATRDSYGQVAGDYAADYSAACLNLTRAGITCEVVTQVPELGKWRCLVLSSAACLSAGQRQRLQEFMEAGGTVIATGPTGHYDERANPVAKPWLEEFGVLAELSEPARPGGFPPYKHLAPPVEIAQCRVPDPARQQMKDGWFTATLGKGRLLWRPERISLKAVADAVIERLRERDRLAARIRGLPKSWRLRQFRDGNRILIHALPDTVETVLHATLKNQFGNERIVEKLRFAPLTAELTFESSATLNRVTLHSPDLAGPRAGEKLDAQRWSVSPRQVSRYFVLEAYV